MTVAGRICDSSLQAKVAKYGAAIIDIIKSNMPLRRLMRPNQAPPASDAPSLQTVPPPEAAAQSEAVPAEAVHVPPPPTISLPGAAALSKAVPATIARDESAHNVLPPLGEDEEGFFPLLGGGLSH